MSNKRKHTTCTFKERLEVLCRLDKGESATKLSLEFGVGRATVTDWKKNRDKIEQFCASSSRKNVERRQTSKASHFDKVDDALFLWFVQEREKGTRLSGHIVREKALVMNNLMKGDVKFSASAGWLDRWKKRHDIRHLTITGGQSSSDKIVPQECLGEFSDIISHGQFSPQQIYNADETSISFKALPDNSLSPHEKARAPGFNMNKERVTLMACSNAAGNHKLPLVVIGKSKNPGALKNMNMKRLPVYYTNQTRAKMEGCMFKEWFHKQFVPEVKRFSKENDLPARALLFIDNAPSHPDVSELTSGEIKAVFLPPTMSALLQPMDQTLKSCKLIYREKMRRFLIEDDNTSLLEKIKQVKVEDVVDWAAKAWDEVTEQALKKSWKKIWPALRFIDTPGRNNEAENRPPLVNRIPADNISDWMEADGLTDDDIVAIVDQRDAARVSHAAAVAALDLASRYVEQQPAATPADVMFFRRWRSIASYNRLPAAFGNDQSLSQSPRGRKRRKTAAHLTRNAPSPCETSTPSATTSGDESSGDDQPPDTKEGSHPGGSVQLPDNSRGSRREGVSNVNVDQVLKTDEQDFEMDIEEGNELARIKEDQYLFETVLCGENSGLYIKEEALDPEEPPPPPTNPLTPATCHTCHLCNAKCNSREDLRIHFASAHPGCDAAPCSTSDAAGGGYFNT